MSADASGMKSEWSRLGSNQRPSACEADALPLSHGTGAKRRMTSKVSTRGRVGRTRCWAADSGAPDGTKKFVRPTQVDYRRASHRATISSVARGCSAVGSASPCQGEGRGFESRRPLGGAGSRLACRRSARLFGTGPAPRVSACGGMAEWLRQGPAKPCTRVRFPLPPRGRLAQRESASLTRKRSLVQSQYRPPDLPGKTRDSLSPVLPLGDYPGDYRQLIWQLADVCATAHSQFSDHARPTVRWRDAC